jgi:hypothetical protein
LARIEAIKVGLKTRLVDAGAVLTFSGARRGRASNSPPQLGHLPLSSTSVQLAQNVHSNEQILASGASGGSSWSQHSQLGLSSSMVSPWHFGRYRSGKQVLHLRELASVPPIPGGLSPVMSLQGPRQ